LRYLAVDRESLKGDALQTTLLGLAVAFILALIAALIGPYFIDWNQFRPQFEAEASRVIGAPIRVEGALDARLLPVPSLRLRSVVLGGANDLGRARADKLDVEFSLGSLMRGEWRADELSINGMALDLGLDSRGKVDWPVSAGKFNLGSLAIDRLNLTGRIALHDAASRATLELDDIAFSGDVRSLAGAIRGDGNFMLSGTRYPFRVSSGQTADGVGTRVRLTLDPGTRALSIDLDGVLKFDAGSPRFDGAMTLASPAKAGVLPKDAAEAPWRLTAKIKADPAAAHFEQLEANYGFDETALKLTGLADIRFGASPLLHAALSARQVDADKLLTKANGGAEPARLLTNVRNLLAAIPPAPLASQIEINAEQIMLGGRPLQGFAAELHGDAKSWTVGRLDFRAPGVTRVSASGTIQPSPAGSFSGALNVDSPDPDTLVAWLQGRGEVTYRNQKPLRLRGNLTLAADRFEIGKLDAEIDGGTLQGRVAVIGDVAGIGSRLEASLQADRLDLDAATAFARSLAGPQAEWPDVAQISLDIGRAISAGQELRPFTAKLAYSPKIFALDQLKIGEASGVMVDGAGSFDRANATGRLSLSATSASLGRITALISPFAPAVVVRLGALGETPGPAHLKLALNLDKNPEQADRANARAVLDIDAPQLKGTAALTATPAFAAVRGIDLDALARSDVSIDTKLSAQGSRLVAWLGLDRTVAAGDSPMQFEASASGAWRAPLRAKLKLSGADLEAEAQGQGEPWASEAKANFNLSVKRANLAPLLNLRSSDPSARNIGLSSRVSLSGSNLAFDDIDSVVAGSRLRGKLAVTLGDEKTVDGEVGIDSLELAPLFGLAIGYAAQDATEPFGRGLLQGWRGQLSFQALRGMLPAGGELRPVSGVIRNDGQSLIFDTIKGKMGGGNAIADIAAKKTADGVALNARLQFTGVDGAALHYRTLTMPAGRASMQMTLSSFGRSASALTGALSGDGLLTLESSGLAGLNPQAFDVALRASDSGQATDDVRLRQIVEPALTGGILSVPSAQIPIAIKEGRLRVADTMLEGLGARVVLSGGYDIAADQIDVRASLASTALGSGTSRPEIGIFAVGTPGGLARSVDIAGLSSWLAVRAIDRETRRLESLERGEPIAPASPASISPITVPKPAETPPASAAVRVPELPLSDVPIPGRAQPPLRPKSAVPRPIAVPPPSNPPVLSQQVAPLPPAVEVRPAPAPPRTRPRQPLVLTPPASGGP
jgi:hypothetical protein